MRKPKPSLIPELDVSDLALSIQFYESFGFVKAYERVAECFAYMELGDVHLMLEAAAGPGRRFGTSPLERPFGRGINFQIEVRCVEPLYEVATSAKYEIRIPLEERLYDVNGRHEGNRQFVVADPDGYLLRFFEDMHTS